MRKTFSFWRWIVGAAIGFGAISFVTYQQHCAAEEYKHHRAEYCATLTSLSEENKACTDEGTSARDYLPWWYELFRWPEGITTWAIILTGFAVAWQSNETRRAADATRASVALQEAAYEQWVSLTDWNNEATGAPYNSLYHRLAISVSIVNRSNYPLTLLEGTITYGHPPDGAIYKVPPNTLLIPNEPFIARVDIPLTSEDFPEFVKGNYMTVVSAGVRFLSVIGKDRAQEFGGLVRLRRAATYFEPHGFVQPSRQSDPQANANDE